MPEQDLSIEAQVHELWRTGKLVHFPTRYITSIKELIDVIAESDDRNEIFDLLSYNQRNRLLKELAHDGFEHPAIGIQLLDKLFIEDLLIFQRTCRCLKTLGHYDFEISERLLLNIAQDAYPKSREFAAEALASVLYRCPDQLSTVLTKWVEHEQCTVRETLARMFFHLPNQGTDQVISYLWQLAHDEFSDVRRAVAVSMRNYLQEPQEPAFYIVSKLSHDKRWETCNSAIESMGFVGPCFAKGALKELRSHVHSDLPKVAKTACQALKEIARRYPKKTFYYYQDIARERVWIDWEVLRQIISSVKEIGMYDLDKARKILTELAKDEDELVSSEAIQVLRNLKVTRDVAKIV